MATKGKSSKTTKMKPVTEVKLTADEARKKVAVLEEELESEKNKLWCHLCGKKKRPEFFYIDTDARSQSGYTAICKDCAKALAERRDEKGDAHTVTKDSLALAMFYLNKPVYDKLWDASVAECLDESKLLKPMTSKLLDISRNYWLSKGVIDWGIVLGESK